MERKICQSCGMPLEDQNLLGTNLDGSSNEDYCKYCYEKGDFKREETMEEMIESCIPFMVKDGMEEEVARHLLEETLPKLKRWQ